MNNTFETTIKKLDEVEEMLRESLGSSKHVSSDFICDRMDDVFSLKNKLRNWMHL